MNQAITDERLYKTILRPYFSEKATLCTEKARQFVFRVATDANKTEIKKAVEVLFKVKVKSVQVSRTKTKPRRVGQIIGKSKSWKKAYVALHDGFDIDFAGSI